MNTHKTLMSLLLLIGIFQQTLGYSDEVFRRMGQYDQNSWVTELTRKIQEQSCETNGGPKAFESWTNSIVGISSCIQDSTSTSNRNDEVSPLDIPAAVMKCIEPRMESLKSCEDSESRKIIDITYKLATGFVYFIGNETQNINNMLGRWGSGMENCPLSKYQDLLVCGEDLITLSGATMVRQAIRHSHGRPGSTSTLTIGTEWSESGCQIFNTFQTCSIKVLNECDDKLNGQLVQSLFEYINAEMPCKDFETSHGSPDRVVNGLFLIVAAIAAIF